MPKFKLIAPLDAAGLDYSRPREQRLWNQLTNVWFNNGSLETRPGLRPVGPLSQDVGTRAAGIITAIGEARDWNSETSSFGITQRLVPSSTVANSGWTVTGAASAHLAVDETVPDDGTTEVHTSTDDATFTLAFGNLVGSPDYVNDVILHIRAKAISPPLNQRLYFSTDGSVDEDTDPYIELSTTDYRDNGEVQHGGWVDYYVPLSVTRSTTTVDDLQITTKLAQDPIPVTVYARPSTTGQDDDFSPSGSDAWLHSSETSPGPYTFQVGCYPVSYVDLTPSIVTGEPGERLSIQFANPTMPTGTLAISNIILNIELAKVGSSLGKATVYHVGTDLVRRTVGTVEVTYHYQGMPWDPGHLRTATIQGTLTTNPETSAAWTAAEVNAGLEFGIDVDSGSADIVFDYASLYVNATLPSGGVGGAMITQMEVLTGTRTTTGTPGAEAFLGRIMATTTSFQRLDFQQIRFEFGGVDFTDILDAAAAPTAAWPNWDMAEFLGSLYFENSTDTTYSFAGGGVNLMDQLTSPLPIGHTMWAFAQRLFKGDVTDSGTRHPLRLAYSALADPDDWTGTTAGDIDLTHGGQGRVRKGLPLSAMTSAVYLDKGIYTLHWTGDDSAPFVPRLMDSDTGIVGPRTCRPVLDKGGESTHLFLGRGPQGLSVYSFDGTSAQNIGGEIQDELARRANHSTVDYSFAWVDPQTNLYMLFVPEGRQSIPEQAWIYHIDTGHWTRWTFPFGVTAVGEWTLIGNEELAGEVDATDGQRYLILGTTFGVPYLFNHDATSDWVSITGERSGAANGYGGWGFFTSSEDLPYPSASLELPIDWVIETGALVLSQEEDVRRLTTPMRLWVTYENWGTSYLTLEVSRDGGANFGAATSAALGSGGVEQAVSLARDHGELALYYRDTILDVNEPAQGRRHVFRLSQNADTAFPRQKVKLSKLMIEYEDNGDMP